MVVYDVQEGATRPLLERGARLAASPGEVAAVSDVIVSSVPGPTEVEEIALGSDGILSGLSDGDVYVDLSTSRPSLIRKIGRVFEEKGGPRTGRPGADQSCRRGGSAGHRDAQRRTGISMSSFFPCLRPSPTRSSTRVT